MSRRPESIGPICSNGRGTTRRRAGASDILGMEVAGTIAGVGEDVDHGQIGDRCVALLAGGGYAELVVAPVGQVVAAPRGMDLVTAAGLIEVAATVVSNFDAAGVRRGETVLIHGGAGGIGSFAIQYAKRRRCTGHRHGGLAPRSSTHCRGTGRRGRRSAIATTGPARSPASPRTWGHVILDVMGARTWRPTSARSRSAADCRDRAAGRPEGHARPRPADDQARLGARRQRCVPAGRREVGHLLPGGRDRVAADRVRRDPAGPPQTTYPLAEAAAAHRLLESGDNIGKVILTGALSWIDRRLRVSRSGSLPVRKAARLELRHRPAGNVAVAVSTVLRKGEGRGVRAGRPEREEKLARVSGGRPDIDKAGPSIERAGWSVGDLDREQDQNADTAVRAQARHDVRARRPGRVRGRPGRPRARSARRVRPAAVRADQPDRFAIHSIDTRFSGTSVSRACHRSGSASTQSSTASRTPPGHRPARPAAPDGTAPSRPVRPHAH